MALFQAMMSPAIHLAIPKYPTSQRNCLRSCVQLENNGGRPVAKELQEAANVVAACSECGW